MSIFCIADKTLMVSCCFARAYRCPCCEVIIQRYPKYRSLQQEIDELMVQKAVTQRVERIVLWAWNDVKRLLVKPNTRLVAWPYRMDKPTIYILYRDIK